MHLSSTDLHDDARRPRIKHTACALYRYGACLIIRSENDLLQDRLQVVEAFEAHPRLIELHPDGLDAGGIRVILNVHVVARCQAVRQQHPVDAV